jgi:hypothetical protein
MSTKRPTEAEYEERIPDAFELILYHKLNYLEFRRTFSKKYGITERQAENVWSDCKDRLKQRHQEKTEEIINDQIQRYFDLLQRARQDNNKRVEREVLADLNKLYGLELKKIDITSNGEPISINISLQD